MGGGVVEFHAGNVSRAGGIVNGISRSMEIKIASCPFRPAYQPMPEQRGEVSPAIGITMH
jgi:hypothetical protein